MAEVADNTDRYSKMDQIPNSAEFIVERVTKLETPFFSARVYHGHRPDGKPDTWVSFRNTEESKASEGLLSNLTKSPLGRIAAGITTAAAAVVGGGAALSACSSGPNVAVQPSAGHGYGVQQGPITLDNLLNVGNGQKIPWSEKGDEWPSNSAIVNGEHHIFFTHNWVAPEERGINYVKGETIEDCLAVGTEKHSVQGLQEGGMWGTFSGAGAFQDQEGNDKLVVGPGNSYAQKCDVAPNDEGLLEVSNCAEMVPPIEGAPSIFEKGNTPMGLHQAGVKVKLRNLFTDIDEVTAANADWAWDCDVGVETASAVIASQMQFYQGVKHCRIVVGSSWEELVQQPIALKNLNKISGYLTSVRVAGPYLIFTNDYNLWLAVIPIDSENPESGELGAETSNADATQPDVPIADGPDAVDEPETSGADADEAETSQGGTDTANPEDVTEDVANAADAAVDAAVDPADSDSQTGDGNGSELPQPEDTGDGEVEDPDNGPSDDPGEADKDAESEPPVEPAPEPQPEPAPEPQPEPTPELDEDTSTEQDPENVPEPAPEQTPESNPEPVTPAEPQPEQTPDPEPQPEPSPEPANTPEPSQSSDAGSSVETSGPEPEKQPQPVPWKTVEVDGGCAAVVEHGKPTDPLTHLTPLALSLLALGASTRRRVQQTLQAVREKFKRAA